MKNKEYEEISFNGLDEERQVAPVGNYYGAVAVSKDYKGKCYLLVENWDDCWYGVEVSQEFFDVFVKEFEGYEG